MQTYETLFVASPTLTEDEERTTVETLSQIVTDGGGTMVANDRMGRRRLAYPIQKHLDGIYVRFLYDSEAEVPKELERRIRLSDRVLRSLTVRLEPKWATAAKEQAVRDEQARIEAAAREKLEQEEAARREAEGLPPLDAGAESSGDDNKAPVESSGDAKEAGTAPAETSGETAKEDA